MKICHVIVHLHDELNSLHGVVIKQYFLPGDQIGKDLSSVNYRFTIDGEDEGLQEIKFMSTPDRKGSIAYLDSDVDAKFRIGFYGIRPR